MAVLFLVNKANNVNLPVVIFSTICPAETKGVGMEAEQKNLEQHMIYTCGTKVPPSRLHDASYIPFSVHQLVLWGREGGKIYQKCVSKDQLYTHQLYSLNTNDFQFNLSPLLCPSTQLRPKCS